MASAWKCGLEGRAGTQLLGGAVGEGVCSGPRAAPRECPSLKSPPRLVYRQCERARARGALGIADAARALHTRTPPAGRDVVPKQGAHRAPWQE